MRRQYNDRYDRIQIRNDFLFNCVKHHGASRTLLYQDTEITCDACIQAADGLLQLRQGRLSGRTPFTDPQAPSLQGVT